MFFSYLCYYFNQEKEVIEKDPLGIKACNDVGVCNLLTLIDKACLSYILSSLKCDRLQPENENHINRTICSDHP